jgi:hypothetical protein
MAICAGFRPIWPEFGHNTAGLKQIDQIPAVLARFRPISLESSN